MYWKLIFQLSIFGLIMAFGTVALIPEKGEPFFWLVIFAFCAFVIAKVCGEKYFMHGFLVSLVNCVWIVAVHLFFRATYLAHHPSMAAMKIPAPLGVHPRLAMIIFGAVAGVISGIILGLFSLAASKIINKE